MLQNSERTIQRTENEGTCQVADLSDASKKIKTSHISHPTQISTNNRIIRQKLF